jgi:hypothetical protein
MSLGGSDAPPRIDAVGSDAPPPGSDVRLLTSDIPHRILYDGEVALYIYIQGGQSKESTKAVPGIVSAPQLPLPHTVKWHLARCILHRIRACRIRSPQSALPITLR